MNKVSCMDLLCRELVSEFYANGNSTGGIDDYDCYEPSHLDYYGDDFNLTYWYERNMNVIIYHHKSDPTKDFCFIPASDERARFMYILTYFQREDNWLKAVQSSTETPLFDVNKSNSAFVSATYYGDDN